MFLELKFAIASGLVREDQPLCLCRVNSTGGTRGLYSASCKPLGRLFRSEPKAGIGRVCESGLDPLCDSMSISACQRDFLIGVVGRPERVWDLERFGKLL